MSKQLREVSEYLRVCDLCGKAVDVRNHRDWSTMNVGHPTSPPTSPMRHMFAFLRMGVTEKHSGAPENDHRSWRWDFHGECLVEALTPLVRDEAAPPAKKN